MSRFEGAIVRSEKGAKIRMILNYSNRKSKLGNVKSKKNTLFSIPMVKYTKSIKQILKIRKKNILKEVNNNFKDD